jgi:chromate transporter
VSGSKDLEGTEENPFSASIFLRDVFVCSLVAFGGPEAHIGVFLDRLVVKKNYLTEKGLMEWMALCSFLPGPTSTQVITGIGLERGGRSLALLTLGVWALPMILLMGCLSFIPQVFGFSNSFPVWLEFLVPMAAGFVAWATWQIGLKVVTNKLSVALWAQGFAVVLMSGSPWGIPLILLSGGILGIVLDNSQKSALKNNPSGNFFPWGIFLFFVGITSICWIVMQLSSDSLIVLFERFYRYGYLVFGGGQVVVPVMQGELVDQTGLLTAEEFLSGFGLVQALPGPMFSFAAFAGGLSENHGTITRQALGALLGGFTIFLPGTLLLFCIHPIWEKFRSLPWVPKTLAGLNATAGGLIGGALVEIILGMDQSVPTYVFFLLTLFALMSRKIPAPILVILLGIISWGMGLVL